MNASVVLTPSAPGRVHLQVTALDQDWRPRVTFDSEVPDGLLPAIERLQQRTSAFDLARLSRQSPLVPPGDLRQLLERLVKASALRQLVPRG